MEHGWRPLIATALLTLHPLPTTLRAQAGELEDERLAPVVIVEPPSLKKQVLRARELEAKGDHQGVVKILDNLCRQELQGLGTDGSGIYLPVHNLLAVQIHSFSLRTREAWNLLHESAAGALRRQGLEERRPDLLMQVVKRHPATPSWRAALIDLGDIQLDRGCPEAALRWYRQARVGDGDDRLTTRIILSLLAMGDREGAKKEVALMEGRRPVVAGLPLSPGELEDHPDWRGSNGTDKVEPALDLTGLVHLWRFRTEKLKPPTQSSRSRRYVFPKRGAMLSTRCKGPLTTMDSLGPVVVIHRGRAVMCHRRGMDMVERETGRLVERLRPRLGLGFVPGQTHPSDPACALAERRLEVQGERLYFLGDNKQLARVGLRPPFYRGPTRTMMHSIMAWDSGRNRLLWQVRVQSLPPPLDKACTHSGPVVVGGRVMVILSLDNTFHLLALEEETGRVAWHLPLHAGGSNFLRPPALPMASQGNVVFAATGAGAVSAIDAREGEILWTRVYPRIDPQCSAPFQVHSGRTGRSRYRSAVSVPLRGFLPSQMIVQGGFLVVAPPDSDWLMALSTVDGSIRWLSSRLDPRRKSRIRSRVDHLIGHDGEAIYLSGSVTMAIELTSGRRLWEVETPKVNGRGLVTEGTLLIPTDSGLLAVDSRNGEKRFFELADYPSGQVNLHSQGPFLFLSSLAATDCWVQARAWIDTARTEGEKALRMATCGDLAGAIDTLEKTAEPDRDLLLARWTQDLVSRMLKVKRTRQATALLRRSIATVSPPHRLDLVRRLIEVLTRSGDPVEAGRVFRHHLVKGQDDGRSTL